MLRGLLVVEYRCRADELSVVSVAVRAGRSCCAVLAS